MRNGVLGLDVRRLTRRLRGSTVVILMLTSRNGARMLDQPTVLAHRCKNVASWWTTILLLEVGRNTSNLLHRTGLWVYAADHLLHRVVLLTGLTWLYHGRLIGFVGVNDDHLLTVRILRNESGRRLRSCDYLRTSRTAVVERDSRNAILYRRGASWPLCHVRSCSVDFVRDRWRDGRTDNLRAVGMNHHSSLLPVVVRMRLGSWTTTCCAWSCRRLFWGWGERRI